MFISSTFRDMQAERDELTKFIFPELRKLCQERGLTLTSVDLRWGITEEDANRAGVLSICLDEIQRCRPYFIGILGERYGWVPEQVDRQLREAEPWLTGLEGCSITELEILHGVLNDPEMAAHTFFYFRDPAYLETLPHDLRESYREQDGTDSAKKLLDLKARIQASSLPLVENFPDPRKLGEHVRQDLTRVINAQFPVGTKPSPLEQERLEQESFAASRSMGYIARPEAFERLDQHINNSGPPLTVLGESGSGKTALLANWIEYRREEHPNDFTFLHLIGSTAASMDWAVMLRRCIAELQIHIDIQEKIADDHDELRVQFANWLSMAASDSRLVLVIDALDQLEDRQGAPDLVWLPENLPENARIILSTLPGRPLEVIHKRGWPTYELALLDVGERVKITEAYLGLFRKRLSEAALRRIARAPQTANPLYLRTLLDELRIFGEHEGLAERIDLYLEARSIEALFEQIMMRYEQDYNRDRTNLVQDAFSMIYAARRGLSESELLDLLGSAGEPLPRAYWSPFFLVVEPSLVNRAGLIGFFHQYLRSAIERRYLPSEEDKHAVHRTLAAYFEGRELGHRVVEELPWQWMQAGEWQQLARCLGDTDFLQRAWEQSQYDARMFWAVIERRTDIKHQDAYEHVLEEPLKHAHVLKAVANLMYEMGSPQLALKLHEARIELVRTSDETLVAVNALEWKARILRERGEFDQAMRIQQYLGELYLDAGDELGYAGTLGSRALVLQTQGDLEGAMSLFREEEEIILKMGSRKRLGEVFHNQGTILFLQGKYEQALGNFEQSEQIVREYGDKVGLADNRGARAAVLSKLGKFDLALEEFNRVEEIQRKLGDKARLKLTLGNQASILRHLDRLEEALAINRKQEQISRELGDKETLAASLNGQGLVHKQRGDFEAALSIFEEMESISRDLGTTQTLQAALGNQASILHQLGQLDRALPIREEEIEICRRAGYQEDLARALSTKTDLLYDLKRYEEALPAAQEAYELAQDLGLKEMIEDLEKNWFPQ